MQSALFSFNIRTDGDVLNIVLFNLSSSISTTMSPIIKVPPNAYKVVVRSRSKPKSSMLDSTWAIILGINKEVIGSRLMACKSFGPYS